ncbi:MAG: DUF429 domain-containing protein [Methylococcaceae bacterium]|nr:DUF429 domain-containing protein [Methylococcaceae bacterium]
MSRRLAHRDPGTRTGGTAQFFPSLGGLAQEYDHGDPLLTDRPIGLPERKPRACGRDARSLLEADLRSSVFPLPCRAVLAATHCRDAGEINRKHLEADISKDVPNNKVP